MLPMDADIQEINNQIVEQRTIYNQNIKYHLAFSKAGILSAIVKLPPKDTKSVSYQELPRTLEDENKIDDLITTIGVLGKMDLLLHHEKRLRKMGDELRYIHPFKFIGYIFSKPDLKGHMGSVFDDYFKRSKFVKDYSQTMDIYDLRNKLYIYLEDFANEVNIPSHKIKPFIDNKDWEGLLRFLINY